MLSQEAELALGQLESGAVLNAIHTTARELIDIGFAYNDYGRLVMTEAGRVWVRKSHGRRFVINDDHIYEMPANPMGLGPEVPVVNETVVVVDTTYKPASYYDRALRAAGIASGKTGEWPTSEWVQAFMDAFEEGKRDGVE